MVAPFFLMLILTDEVLAAGGLLTIGAPHSPILSNLRFDALYPCFSDAIAMEHEGKLDFRDSLMEVCSNTLLHFDETKVLQVQE